MSRKLLLMCSWAFLMQACTEPSVLPTVDGGEACEFAGGRICPRGAVCSDGLGCNVCQCTDNGMQCSAMHCFDAGVSPCTRNEDCSEGTCVFDVGCGVDAAGYCTRVTCYTAAQEPGTYCSCDGRTFEAECPREPYRSVGACP